MGAVRITDVLGGKVAAGSQVTVQVWIRTRRDSKAGLSFLAVHDGSCFAPVQVIAEAGLGAISPVTSTEQPAESFFTSS